jgi:predicted ribosomally synthesized peptide with nif11-like leader
MSEEQLKAFLEVLKSDTSLQEKLKLEQDANILLEIAKAIGFGTSSFSTEDQLRLSRRTRGCCRGLHPFQFVWQPRHILLLERYF